MRTRAPFGFGNTESIVKVAWINGEAMSMWGQPGGEVEDLAPSTNLCLIDSLHPSIYSDSATSVYAAKEIQTFKTDGSRQEAQRHHRL
jgi:hypothetical protein